MSPTRLGVTITKTDKTVELSGPALSSLPIVGKKFTVPTFSDQVPAQSVSADKIIVPRVLFDAKKLNKTVPEPSLYEYCKGKGMPTASYLPKVLYESLQPKPVQPEEAPLGLPLPPVGDAVPVPVL